MKYKIIIVLFRCTVNRDAEKIKKCFLPTTKYVFQKAKFADLVARD